MDLETALEKLEDEPNFENMTEDERRDYLENLYETEGPGRWRKTLISKFLRRE